MKVAIFGKREYDFVGSDGGQVHGIMYSAFIRGREAIEFSSQTSDHEVKQITEFDPKSAIDLNIQARVFDGKVKYREVL